MLKKIFLGIVFFLLITNKNLSQEIPPINIYTTEDYGAENQNWSMTQGDNRFIYVANNKGLLEFNGANWSLYTSPNETIMRSVYFFDNKVFSGFYMDFGYWKKNNSGILEYSSLVKENAIEMLEDEQIWEIVELDGWLLFKSFQRIYMYNLKTKSVQIIKATNTIVKLSNVDGTLYFQELDKGIFKIENGKPNLISNDKVLKENKVVEMFSKDSKLYVLTQKQGFYYLDNNKLKSWKPSSSEFLSTKTIYSAKKLVNNSLVLGTISNGLIYLNKNGAVNYQITQSLGLSNNTVLSVFEDKSNNIWLGLDNGINTVNLSSPFKIYAKHNNFWGTVYASVVFKNKLYLGTNQGLYVKELDDDSDFKFVKNTEGQVWNLQVVDGTLFCAHDSGTFIVLENGVTPIQTNTGAWGIKKIDNNTLLQGAYDGLYVLKKKNNTWVLKNKVEGFSNSSRYFLKLEDNRVFVNHEYKGVFKLKLNKDFTKVLDIKKDNSVEKGIHSSLVKYNNAILYACKKGIYKFDKKSDTFVIDSAYSKLMPEDKFLSAKLINDKKTNKLWAFTKEDIRYLTPGKLSDKPKIEIIPITGAIHKGASGYENIINIKDKEYLIGTSSGYIIVDLNTIKAPDDFQVHINKVYNFKLDDDEQTIVNIEKDKAFHYQKNNLVFHYSVPNYTKTSSIKYQYILEGFNEKWSSKTANNTILFENLNPNNYVFKVKAFIDDKGSENIESFSFTIENPWYLTSLFKFFYISLIIAFVFIAHYFTKRYYKKQREELLERNQKELELKELENSQKIIKLNNDKLRSDIENKNRELATSTMSIIKKNEFLNTIKNELVSGGKNNVDSVIRIINKNLNNTDDWKMFQEAFNNADKNFIKKVKAKHPQLTPNDLRLCAYLRLNLSSKEIAPLLNISPRSVEVKRYRLRKKMNLEHDENLTEYIISL